MAFRIRDREDDAASDWIGEWAFPPLTHFIASDAFDVLYRELERYVLGEVPGRSFLIAGHRGVGKTTLVRRVVDELNRDVLRSMVGRAQRADTQPASPPDRQVAPQRPLLVRLHGPSLLESDSLTSEQGEAAPGDGSATDRIVTILEQVTIGLYRSIAAEAARCVAARARDMARSAGEGGPSAGDVVEVAAQFTLELDNAPKPILLRAFYQRLGCLRAGVFWPRQVGSDLLQAGLLDQGAREIVALATAAQAFEICSGDVKSSETQKDLRGREQSLEAKSDLNLKDLANKALGVAAAVAVGLGMAGEAGPAMAAAAALAAGLVTTATLSFASKRSLKSERTLDYAFIRDRSKRTLERDLPLMIQRVREAGLAPVFVVDELDKIEKAGEAVASLIRRLKHLTTDYGVFCFLTDRRYFDEVMRKVEAEAFPPEHTFFSHRLYVLHRPQAMLNYLGKVILPVKGGPNVPVGDASPPVAAGQDATSSELALATLGLYLLHRSKLNTVDLVRELARLSRDDGSLRLDASGAFDYGFRFAATIQLAINLVLKGREVAQRFETEPRFAQLAADALYHLSRCWEGEKVTVALRRDAVIACLRDRTADRTPTAFIPGTGGGDGLPEDGMAALGLGRVDLDLLVDLVAQLATLLGDFRLLEARLEAEYGPEGRRLAKIVPRDVTSKLIVAVAGKAGDYRFLFDVYGDDIAMREALRAAASALPAELADAARETIKALDALNLALSAGGLDLKDLVAAGVLSPTLDAVNLDAARSRLSTALRAGASYEGFNADHLAAVPVASFLRGSGRLLAILLRLVADVAAVAALGVQAPSRRTALAAIERFVDLQGAFRPAAQSSDEEEASAHAILVAEFLAVAREAAVDVGSEWLQLVPSRATEVMEAIGVDDWSAMVSAQAGQRPEELGSRDAAAWCSRAWQSWIPRLQAYLAVGRSTATPASYADVICAAAGLPPGALLRRDLGAMSFADWTAVCLKGFPAQVPSSPSAPAWTFVVGLRVLGFGQSDIQAAIAELPTAPAKDNEVADLLNVALTTAPRGRSRATVLIMAEHGPSLGVQTVTPSKSARANFIALREQELAVYNDALNWLARRGALAGLSYEREKD